MDTIKALLGILVVLGITYLGLIVVIRALSFIFSPVAAYTRKHGLPKHFYPIFFVVLGLVFVVKAVVFPPGYCSEQQRFLNDEEYVNTVKDVFEWRVNNPIRSGVTGAVLGWDTDSTEYKHFEKMRPSSEGYHLYRYSTHHPIWARLFNKEIIEVTLYVGESTGDSQINFYFDRCGNLIWGGFAYMYPPYDFFTTRNHPVVESSPKIDKFKQE
ncbi:MAG: hypothetical protein ACYC3A_08320 [Halothiobacillus sp.]